MKKAYLLLFLVLPFLGISQDVSSTVNLPNPYGYQFTINNTLSARSSTAFFDEIGRASCRERV